jgi:predicted ArsR family transcriptional regulator
MPPDSLDAVDALGTLTDATRRRLYEHVTRQSEPVSRDDAASAVGIGRTLAAYHLDRLADEGLLTVTFARRSGRTGPGAGRPAKLYTRAERELAVSAPPRDYALVARLLADAAAADASGHTRRSLVAAAAQLGREIAAEVAEARPELEPLLRARGYEPFHDGEGILRLRNCPFHVVAQRHPGIVCEMNRALLEGLVGGLPAAGLDVALEPQPCCCCVAIRQAPTD